MDTKKIAEFKKRLTDEKKELENELNYLTVGNLNQRQSEMSGESSQADEEADNATATFERERDLSMDINVQDILEQVDEALKRIENGKFGICESCGKDIEGGRLDAIPYTSLCISCKSKED